MPQENEKVIIDAKDGNITDKFSQDKVILTGVKKFESSDYLDDLVITINKDVSGDSIEKKISYAGYDLRLFLGDFNGDGVSEIMIKGLLEKSIGSYMFVVYAFKDDDLVEIYNHNRFNMMSKFDCKYLDNYRAEIISEKTKEKYIVDLSLRPRRYLDLVYDDNGKLKENSNIKVTNLRNVYAIETDEMDIYNLALTQVVVGQDNEDLISTIESIVSLTNNIPKIKKIEVLISGAKEYIMSRKEVLKDKLINNLPPDAINIPLGDISNNKIISKDFDGDGQEEVLVAYTLKGKAYVGLNKKYDGGMYFIDAFEGNGHSIKDLDVVNVNKEFYILVGWIDNKLQNNIDILSLKNGELNRAFKYNLPHYDKMFLEDIKGDGKKELILWVKDIDKAYNIAIYEFCKSGIRKTNKYDSIYFEKVIKYYDTLLDNDTNSAVYLYHLAIAQYRTYDYSGANDTIKKALKLKDRYPSNDEFNKLRLKIRKSFRK